MRKHFLRKKKLCENFPIYGSIHLMYSFSHTKTSYLLVVQSVFISRGDGGVNLNLGGHTFSGVVRKLSWGSLSEAVKAAFNASGS